jgi:tRNA (guanine37-N1)-methyltransferase
MEVIAGDENMDVEVSEGNCKFRFNFGEVYWNSRLQTEHDRIVSKILSQGKTRPAVVADMFAGVGPFSIPLAHRRATVYANDLNPSSYNYLVANAKLNKIPSNRHYSSNQDGREFMRELILKGVRPTDVIMNLPASAIEFLDVFKGLYLPEDTSLPTIHCYSFSDAEDLEAATIAEIESVLGTKLVSPFVHNVRDVAPKKFMLCTTFVLPTSIERRLVDPAERPSSPKRQRL